MGRSASQRPTAHREQASQLSRVAHGGVLGRVGVRLAASDNSQAMVSPIRFFTDVRIGCHTFLHAPEGRLPRTESCNSFSTRSRQHVQRKWIAVLAKICNSFGPGPQTRCVKTIVTANGRNVESLVSTGTKILAAVFEARKEISHANEPPSIGPWFRRIVMPGCAVGLFWQSEG